MWLVEVPFFIPYFSIFVHFCTMEARAKVAALLRPAANAPPASRGAPLPRRAIALCGDEASVPPMPRISPSLPARRFWISVELPAQHSQRCVGVIRTTGAREVRGKHSPISHFFSTSNGFGLLFPLALLPEKSAIYS